MNQQEQARIQVLNSVLEHHLPIAQAAGIMGVSERHKNPEKPRQLGLLSQYFHVPPSYLGDVRQLVNQSFSRT